MEFSKEKESELTKKLLMIYTGLVIESRQKPEKEGLEYMSNSKFFFEKVYKQIPTLDPKELFLLGALAQEVFDLAPQTFYMTIKSFIKE